MVQFTDLDEENQKKERIKVIQEMIRLKEENEKKELKNHDNQKLLKLKTQYPEYADLNLEELQEKLNAEQNPSQKIAVVSEEDTNEIVKYYDKQFKTDEGYKEGYEKPKVDGKQTTLSFPSQDAMKNFVQELASKGLKFTLVDPETNKVMAYSNGDGRLRHSDGEEFQEHEKLTPGTEDADKFEIPQRSHRPGL